MCFPIILFGQPKLFQNDSILILDGKVTFDINFNYKLNKEEFSKRVNLYINRKFHPLSGEIIENNIINTICKVVDYISIDSSAFQKYGIYMIYSMSFEYTYGLCHMVLNEISFLEKGYYDAYMDDSDKRLLPTLTAKEVMLDHEFKMLLVKNVSERITIAALERINGTINDIHKIFNVK